MLKCFDHFNANTAPCPVCQTKTDSKIILIPIDGTEIDGIAECINLRYKRDPVHYLFLIYQKITDKNILRKSGLEDSENIYDPV